MRSLTAGYHSLTQSLTRSLPHSLQDRARELVATMARARARELVTTLDGERLRAALCLLPLAWVRTVKGLAGTMAETPATPAQTLTTMATIIMNLLLGLLALFAQAKVPSSDIDTADLSGFEALTLQGAAANDQFGTSISAAGDLNNDGYADLIVGA
ncbi:hypothetical protein B484DRAFT_424673 [Ochromonadaceae sp. CCMP2298]|nr:hypothetical protein B484DRAFT_424673 [Ochromonadaceae sp. CCMP2298]